MTDFLSEQNETIRHLTEIRDRLPDHLDMSDVEKIEICETQRNNGVLVPCIRVFYKSTPVSPCVFPPSFFHLPYDLAAACAAKEIEKRLKGARELCENPGLKENWKDHVFITLVNRDKNKAMLKSAVSRPFFDLEMVVRWNLQLSEDSGVMLCPVNAPEMLGVSGEEFFETARENTRRLFTPELELLSDFLNRIGMDEEVEDTVPLYILTHSGRTFGAVMMTYEDVCERTAEKLGGSFYLLPSSLHEMLVVSERNNIEKDALKGIIHEVNDTLIDKSDILSYSLYYYDEKTKKISIVQ